MKRVLLLLVGLLVIISISSVLSYNICCQNGRNSDEVCNIESTQTGYNLCPYNGWGERYNAFDSSSNNYFAYASKTWVNNGWQIIGHGCGQTGKVSGNYDWQYNKCYCIPDNSCKYATCQGAKCKDSCGNEYFGEKIAKTVCDSGKVCGTQPSGCGWDITCGTCSGSLKCKDGKACVQCLTNSDCTTAGQSCKNNVCGINQIDYTLTITKDGASTSDGQININNINTNSNLPVSTNYDSGTQLILYGRPSDADTTFSWSGCTSVDVNNYCHMTMNGNKDIKIKFEKKAPACIPGENNKGNPCMICKQDGSGWETAADGATCNFEKMPTDFSYTKKYQGKCKVDNSGTSVCQSPCLCGAHSPGRYEINEVVDGTIRRIMYSCDVGEASSGPVCTETKIGYCNTGQTYLTCATKCEGSFNHQISYDKSTISPGLVNAWLEYEANIKNQQNLFELTPGTLIREAYTNSVYPVILVTHLGNNIPEDIIIKYSDGHIYTQDKKGILMADDKVVTKVPSYISKIFSLALSGPEYTKLASQNYPKLKSLLTRDQVNAWLKIEYKNMDVELTSDVMIKEAYRTATYPVIIVTHLGDGIPRDMIVKSSNGHNYLKDGDSGTLFTDGIRIPVNSFPDDIANLVKMIESGKIDEMGYSNIATLMPGVLFEPPATQKKTLCSCECLGNKEQASESEVRRSSFSTYMVRSNMAFSKNGIAYRFLPNNLILQKNVTMQFREAGEVFSGVSNLGVYRFEDSEINNNCNYRILNKTMLKIGKTGGLLQLDEVTLTVPANALKKTISIEIDKMVLNCDKSSSSASSSKTTGNAILGSEEPNQNIVSRFIDLIKNLFS